MSTGIDSEADVTAFAATETRLLPANICEKRLNPGGGLPYETDGDGRRKF